MSDLVRALLEELAADPVALERLRELVGDRAEHACFPSAPAYTVSTLAREIGRSERSIRAAIARGELSAVKRGRGWVISADAVAEWARGEFSPAIQTSQSRLQGKNSRRPRSGPGPMARALERR